MVFNKAGEKKNVANSSILMYNYNWFMICINPGILEERFVKSKRFVSVLFDLLQQLLETEDMTDALSGTL